MGERLLRLEDVAHRLGMSYTQVRVMVVEGIIPHVKVGARGIRVEASELDKYIEVRRAKDAAATAGSN